MFTKILKCFQVHKDVQYVSHNLDVVIVTLQVLRLKTTVIETIIIKARVKVAAVWLFQMIALQGTGTLFLVLH